jgi:hypothetical protein
MMGHRETMRSGDEYDAFHRISRRLLNSFRRSGVAHFVKKKFSRRVRHEARQAARLNERGRG